MSESCETVVIETENGSVVINKSDFDSKKHTLAGQKSEKPVKKSKKKVSN